MFDFGGDIVWEKLHASHSSGVKGLAQFVMTHPLIFYWLLYIAKSPDSSDAITPIYIQIFTLIISIKKMESLRKSPTQEFSFLHLYSFTWMKNKLAL